MASRSRVQYMFTVRALALWSLTTHADMLIMQIIPQATGNQLIRMEPMAGERCTFIRAGDMNQGISLDVTERLHLEYGEYPFFGTIIPSLNGFMGGVAFLSIQVSRATLAFSRARADRHWVAAWDGAADPRRRARPD
jgi:hypothetical protein